MTSLVAPRYDSPVIYTDTGRMSREWYTFLVNLGKTVGTTTGVVHSTRRIDTTYPLAGGGDLSADRTLSITLLPTTTAKQTNITLPAPARQSHSVVVVDTSVAATSKIMLSLAGVPPSAVNEWDDIDLLDMLAIPAVGYFTFLARFLNPISGPLLVNYLVA